MVLTYQLVPGLTLIGISSLGSCSGENPFITIFPTSNQTQIRSACLGHIYGSNKTVHLYGLNHHHVAPSVQISLTLSRHPSLSSIASGRSSRSHPVSALDFGPEHGPGKGTMADSGPLIRHLVSTRLPSGGRAAFLSPLSPLYGTRPCV